MTHAAVPSLSGSTVDRRRLAAAPVLAASTTRASCRPSQVVSALIGMAMTEKQGGSDVRANTTARASTPADGAYLLTGHKWFCSAPMSDGFLVLAQTGTAGLSCFLRAAGAAATACATCSASSG